MNWAINEAIFRSRREGLTQDTLRLWQSSKSVVLGGSASYERDANPEVCRKYGVEIIRAASVSSEGLYQDLGSLNFTIAADVASFKNLIENYKPILSEYQILNESVAKALQKFGVDPKADPSGIYVDNGRISKALPYWFEDLLLFQGTLYISTDLNVYEEVIGTKKDRLTTLTREVGQNISMDEVKKALVQGVEERFGVRFEAHGMLEDEQKLIEKLHRVKYSFSEWNVKAHEPFLIGMGKIPVEVYVANPPTSMCRKLINLVSDAVSDLQDEIKVMIWVRGRGKFQHGPYPEVTLALVRADKESKVPVIIINGQVKFSKAIPSKEDLRKALLASIHTPYKNAAEEADESI